MPIPPTQAELKREARLSRQFADLYTKKAERLERQVNRPARQPRVRAARQVVERPAVVEMLAPRVPRKALHVQDRQVRHVAAAIKQANVMVGETIARSTICDILRGGLTGKVYGSPRSGVTKAMTVHSYRGILSKPVKGMATVLRVPRRNELPLAE